MNYYPFHLGDYAAHTAHLEPMEDLAYRRMLDLYYRTEKPLPTSVEDIARLVRMRDFASAVRDVLNEFFELTDSGWKHARCEAEISKMQDKQAKARASAQASVNARSANAQRTLSERSADVELPTPTPTPKENPPTPRKRGKPGEPAGFDDFWKAYPRRVARGAAVKAWQKLAPDEALQARIATAIERAIDSPEWRKDGGAFVPHPATWLNAQRWLDEPVRIVSASPTVEVWTPPPPPTAEERAASEEARKRVMAAVRISA